MMAPFDQPLFRSPQRRKTFEFTTEPLPPDGKHIRIAKLLPGSADFDNILKIEIEVYNLEEQLPHYSALSYTWHVPNSDTEYFIDPYGPVLCAGRVCHVTWNLWYALGFLRHADQPRYLWVDQICIRQGDTTEKSHQIPLMQTIYRKAPGGVVAWLGKTAPTDVLRYMRHIFGKPFWNEDEFDMTQDSVNEKYIMEDRNSEESAAYTNGVKALLRFLARPWFNRIWIVQEATAQKDRLTFQFGEFSIPFSILLQVVEETNRMLVAAKPTVHNEPDSERTTYFSFLRACPTLDKVGTPGARPLQQLVQNFCSWDSTDPRDKIYALLGLASDAALYPAPDYNKDAATLFRQIATIWLNSGLFSVLSTLSFAVLHDRVPNQPSWFVDWREFGSEKPISPLRNNHNFSAGGDIGSAERSYEFDGSVLRLDGYIVDKVLEAGVTLETRDTVRAWLRDAQRLLNKHRSGRAESDNRDIRSDLASLLVLDGESTLYEADGEAEYGEVILDPRFIEAGDINPSFQYNVALHMNGLREDPNKLGGQYFEEGVNRWSARFDNPSSWPDLRGLWSKLGHASDRIKPGTRPDPTFFVPVRIDMAQKEAACQAAASNEDEDRSNPENVESEEDGDRSSREDAESKEDEDRSSLWVESEEEQSEDEESRPRASDGLRAFRDAIWSINAGNRIIITESGMIGIANSRTEPGDAVIVFRGARMPFVARPAHDGDGYSTVSEAFVRGVMQGQSIDERSEWESIMIV